ncbi:type IV pilus major pilin [Salmonella enterica]|nr:type IV pilus major pilin [Salmonella enterica subsp. enterica serovar Infantis]EDW6859422.1 type IV pilus major pilin [Salmonella enterica]EEJ5736461.1 type IV pilus major pilin [Salmonella enterica]
MAQPEKYLNLKKQRGMTLLEIIIVLGIIGVIAAGVVILAQRAFDTKAMSDLANNANSVRVAVKDAYGPSGEYPVEVADKTQALKNVSDILGSTDTPIGKLVALGKLSPDEALNGISGNYIDIGPGEIGAKTNAGYFIQLNGLSQQQCRGLLNTMGNQWDYVQVPTTGDAAGTYTPRTVKLDTQTATVAAGGSLAANGIYRSLYTSGGTTGTPDSGAKILTPDMVVGACSAGNANTIIFGSR